MINRDRNLRLQYLAGHGPEPLPERADLRRACSQHAQLPGEHVHRIAGDDRRRCGTAFSALTRPVILCPQSTHDTAIASSPRCGRRSSPSSAGVRPARGRRGRRHAAGPADATGVLEAQRGAVRAERLLPVRQPGVERDLASSRSSRICSRATRPGGVYLGVGPEQNFTYIAALKPKMVFITDIRRGNLHMHLMYKALFEMSADRADFVSRLFTKKRPAGLTAKSTAAELVERVLGRRPDARAPSRSTRRTCKAIQDHLTKKRNAAARRRRTSTASSTSTRTSTGSARRITYNSSIEHGAARRATWRPTAT